MGTTIPHEQFGIQAHEFNGEHNGRVEQEVGILTVSHAYVMEWLPLLVERHPFERLIPSLNNLTNAN